jgi:hypothetical protein
LVGDRKLTNAERQARHRAKVALAKRRALVTRTRVDLDPLPDGEIDPGDLREDLPSLEEGDALTSEVASADDLKRVTVSAGYLASMIWKPDD